MARPQLLSTHPIDRVTTPLVLFASHVKTKHYYYFLQCEIKLICFDKIDLGRQLYLQRTLKGPRVFSSKLSIIFLSPAQTKNIRFNLPLFPAKVQIEQSFQVLNKMITFPFYKTHHPRKLLHQRLKDSTPGALHLTTQKMK